MVVLKENTQFLEKLNAGQVNRWTQKLTAGQLNAGKVTAGEETAENLTAEKTNRW